ncbi:MAG: peptidoglycan DD-metalloendopeptidase family protein [Oscillospiraceae bacterium]|nr:peptidoglycan DD-metalloendopeptidase family protein [Oscillospiraceae bacterium]
MDEYAHNSRTAAKLPAYVGARAPLTLPGSRKKRAMALLLAVCVLIAGVLIVSGMRFGLRVSVNGASVGCVKNPAVLKKAVRAAEADVSRLLGEEYKLETSVSSGSAVLRSGERLLDERALYNALMDSVPGVGLYYVVSIGETEIAGVKSSSAAMAAKERALNDYRAENTISIELDSDYAFALKYAPVSSEMSEEELYLALKDMISRGTLSVRSLREETVTEAIPYETQCIDTDELALGEMQVAVEGEEGAVVRTLETQYVNGDAVASKTISNEILQNAVTEKIELGTYEPGTPTGSFIWPTQGVLTSPFGYRSVAVGSSFHKGIDIGTSTGTPIIAADGGTVIYADWISGYGKLVEIAHDNGFTTRYAHCSALAVSVGEKVDQGELIAYVGNTGVSSGSHLHFEVRINGEPYNPLNYLD